MLQVVVLILPHTPLYMNLTQSHHLPPRPPLPPPLVNHTYPPHRPPPEVNHSLVRCPPYPLLNRVSYSQG